MAADIPEVPRKKSNPSEKRREERFPTHLSARFRKINLKDLGKADLTYHTCWVRDMSKSGMRMEADLFIPLGQELEIFVDDRVSGESFFGVVETVRSKKGIDFFELGVKFVKKEQL